MCHLRIILQVVKWTDTKQIATPTPWKDCKLNIKLNSISIDGKHTNLVKFQINHPPKVWESGNIYEYMTLYGHRSLQLAFYSIMKHDKHIWNSEETKLLIHSFGCSMENKVRTCQLDSFKCSHFNCFTSFKSTKSSRRLSRYTIYSNFFTNWTECSLCHLVEGCS